MAKPDRNMNGEANPNSKLSIKEVRQIREELKHYEHGMYLRLARKYYVSVSTIKLLHQNKTWKDSK